MDRADIVRDVVADRAVAAGGAEHEQAVLVGERDGHAVDLQLQHPLDGARVRLLEKLFDAAAPGGEVGGIVGVVDREHRQPMPHRLELRYRLVADPLRGAVGRHQFGMFVLEHTQVGEQAIVVAVADLRCRLDVILPVVMPDLLPQTFDLSGGRRSHGRSVPAASWSRLRLAADSCSRSRFCRSPSK